MKLGGPKLCIACDAEIGEGFVCSPECDAKWAAKQNEDHRQVLREMADSMDDHYEDWRTP